MKSPACFLLSMLVCVPLLPSAAELEILEDVVLLDADMNDGDSFRVRAGDRKLHLRLYFVDCPETDFGSAAELERIRDQQHHFGLEDPHDVVRFGERAADFVAEALAEPFSVHTAYAWAPGRSATGRYYAFVDAIEAEKKSFRFLAKNSSARTRSISFQKRKRSVSSLTTMRR